MSVPPTVRSRWLHPNWWLVLALAAYAIFLWPRTYVAPCGSDSSGYFNAAKVFSHGAVSAPLLAVEGLPATELPLMTYLPLGFKRDLAATKIIPTYPIGLPLLFVGFFAVFGIGVGAKLTLITHGVLGLLMIYVLARRLGAGARAAILGTVALAFSPLYLLYSMQAMSDVPALAWVASAIWLALVSRDRPRWALAAGFAFGFAVLIRPTNALALAPLLLALGRPGRSWIWFGLGGLPCAIGLAAFNHSAYGGIAASGYAQLPDLLGTEWCAVTLREYARWLPVVGTPLVVFALGFPWLVRAEPGKITLLVVWAAVFFGFYAFYSCTHETWWYMRFILPGLPGIILLAVLVLERIFAALRRPAARLATFAVVLAVNLTSDAHWNRQWVVLAGSSGGELIYAEISQWANQHLPTDAVIFSFQLSGAHRFYSDFVLIRWDVLESTWPRIQTVLHAAHRPIYATLFNWEEEPALKQAIPGDWEKVAQIRQGSVWRLRPPAP